MARGAVVGVLLAFAFIYTVVVERVVYPWLDHSVPGMMHMLSLTATAGVALCAYMLSVLRSPGYVPDEWQHERALESGVVVEVKRRSGERRKCHKCLRYKPPRSHHCRICRRCILRMDHHCTWINNCVGHNNYRCFFCFLLHATAALTHSLLLLLAYALAGSSTPRTHAQLNVSPVRPHAEQQMPTNPSGAPLQSYSDAVYRSLAMVLSLLLLMSVGFLFVWHIQLLMRNKTTIEHHEGVNAKAIADSNGSPGVNVRKHPYDLGDPLTNFEAVLGKSPLRWIIPCDPSAEGDGFSFATRTELTHIAQPKPT